MSILVITTGGTIGGLPHEDPQKPPWFVPMPPLGIDWVRDALATTFASIQTRCVSLEPRDSKNIDETYLKSILAIIGEGPENRILLTHGTDALLKNADFFHQQAGLEGKTLILVGAMTPLANGAESDGYLNLAFALQQLTESAPALAKVNIVLCDFDANGAWKPRLYPYAPGRYEKFYDPDGRYRRLVVSGG